MKINYSFNELNIKNNGVKQYETLLVAKKKWFCEAQLLEFDSSSVTIEYNIDNLLTFEDLKKMSNIFKLQAIRSLADLIFETQITYAINLDIDNIYFDYNANAYQLKLVNDSSREVEEEYLNILKGFIGSLFLNENIEEIYASQGKLIEKHSVVKDLSAANSLLEYKFISDKIIKEISIIEFNDLMHVENDYVSKIKLRNKIQISLLIITISITLFLSFIYIPNRTTQLNAIVSYENKIYEDVLSNLESTNIDSMSPVIKYMMAESTIRISDLSDTQKDNILFNLSPSVVEGILDFWVYIGQGELDKAYNQAIENNDAQQKAYVLLLLINSVQNNPDLDIEEIEGLLATYQGELDSIVASMEEEE